MTSPAHSYSTISTFEQCPHKYYRTKILKDVKEDFSGPAIEYGKAVHKALENYLTLNIDLPPEHAKFQPYAERLASIPGEKFIEHRVALNEDLKEVGFFAKDVAYRAVFDYVAIKDDKALIIDHKTGKVRPTAQMHFASMVAFNVWPQVETIQAAFYWLPHNQHTKMTFERKDEDKLWRKFELPMKQIDDCIESNVWPYKPSPLCRYCPVEDCPHNEQ